MKETYTPREEPMDLHVVPMDVEYLDHMGSDLAVVNAARVSFEVEHDRFTVGKDDKLIKYLARHKHWTPFAHCFAKFRIKAPIFVARQLVKHQVGLVWNEVSRRYVNSTPEFYLPEQYRLFSKDKKQGSHETETVDHFTYEDDDGVITSMPIHEAMEQELLNNLATYQYLLDSGVAPEQARTHLPLTTMTEWIWSGSLAAFARVCSLRLDPHAQLETRLVADLIDRNMAAIFPVSWKALMKVDPCELPSSTPTSLSTEQPVPQKAQ